jgi:hypothetical protein
VDAMVIAVAEGTGAVVLTRDADDLGTLAEGTDPGVVVQRVRACPVGIGQGQAFTNCPQSLRPSSRQAP